MSPYKYVSFDIYMSLLTYLTSYTGLFLYKYVSVDIYTTLVTYLVWYRGLSPFEYVVIYIHRDIFMSKETYLTCLTLYTGLFHTNMSFLMYIRLFRHIWRYIEVFFHLNMSLFICIETYFMSTETYLMCLIHRDICNVKRDIFDMFDLSF